MKLTKPTLIIDKEQVIANIEKMAAKAGKHNLFFRPHFKTHQSRKIGEWFRESGVTGITVSSVEMAEYFQLSGWNDITIAFPINLLEAEVVNELASKCDLKILIVNEEAILHLKKVLTNNVSFLIEIDNGYHRTGLAADDFTEIDKILNTAEKCKLLKFTGFLVHSGNSYQSKSKTDLERIHSYTLTQMWKLKERYSIRHPDLITSLGDTPCCSLLDNFKGIDEIRPGNFVFFDLMQEQIGSCSRDEIAVALACPVVAKNAERLEIAIYHLSKEYIHDAAGEKVFGRIVLFKPNGWSAPLPGTKVISLSQEHGLIKTDDNFFEQVNIGDVIGILPVHSCLTADAMGRYENLEGEEIDHL